MALHKNWERAAAIVEAADQRLTGRKLGKVQKKVLEALLEYGTWPGTWKWSTASVTEKALVGLHKRGLVETEIVDATDWRGNPDPLGRKVTYYRPAKWMLDALNAETNDDAESLIAALK